MTSAMVKVKEQMEKDRRLENKATYRKGETNRKIEIKKTNDRDKKIRRSSLSASEM